MLRKNVEAKIDAMDAELAQRIHQTQEIVAGSLLVTIDDEKKFSLMKEKLKDFTACVRAGGGESCAKGKYEICTSLN